MSKDPNVIRLKPHRYIHVLDNNTNVARLEVGPQTFTRKEHEQVVDGPSSMIMIPPRHYTIVANPVQRAEDGSVLVDEYGAYVLRHGDKEVRFEQKPFPLYPGEALEGKVAPLQVVAANAALRLKAIRDFTDGDVNRTAGDEWLFEGPGTFKPRVEVQVIELIRATILKQNQALRLRARRSTTDRNGVAREAGEEWLHRLPGSYLPYIDEEVVNTVQAHVLTDKKALHLRALRTFTDGKKRVRNAGEEWLVTIQDAETHIPDVYEHVVGEVAITTLSNRQYCVVLDPVGADGKQRFGQKELRKGERSFFLKPGESLERGIQKIYVLGQEEALLLRCTEAFEDGDVSRTPGDTWMIHGPRDYWPPTTVEIVEKRREIALDENEGIYVRDIKTGRVRSITGESYLLKAGEELWEKPLPSSVEELLTRLPRERKGAVPTQRDRTRVVTYRAPHNSAVQVYDYKAKKARVVFGPDLVMLGPDEHFTVLSLSGGTPKREGQIQSLSLLMGPDFMTDIVAVETSDHARLSLQLAYNWYFDIKPDNLEDQAKLFAVPDFVGDVCKAVASRVRGAVAGTSFDDFHRNSADIIKQAVFGVGKNVLKFAANNLVITNVDIQSVEPIDQRTRDSLQKSVQLAIEITTQSQEAAARHEAERRNQEATGRLDRQRIQDEAKAEESRVELLRLQAQTLALEAIGQASADAKAKADASKIVAASELQQSELRAKGTRIKSESELEQMKKRQAAEIAHTTQLYELELSKAERLASIEATKFKQLVDAIGAETIKEMARAGPEMQAKLLGGLGLSTVLLTSGDSPVNLFSTSKGLIGGQ